MGALPTGGHQNLGIMQPGGVMGGIQQTQPQQQQSQPQQQPQQSPFNQQVVREGLEGVGWNERIQ